jgi:NitT/TauT family transport system permease protein
MSSARIPDEGDRREVEDHVQIALAAFERQERKNRWVVRTCWVLLLTISLLLWQLASGRWVDPFWISSPARVLARLVDWIVTGTLWPHLLTTVLEAVTGFLVGASLSLVFGLALGMLPLVYKILSPFLTAAYSLPKITLGPLLILYFGLGFEMKFVLSAIITFFIVFFTTVEAVRLTDGELIAVVRIAGASRWQLTRTTLLPAALSGILSGMRLAVPYALQGAVFGEILASNVGLGYLLQKSAGTFDVTGVFSSLIIITALATAVNETIAALERNTQRWRVN